VLETPAALAVRCSIAATTDGPTKQFIVEQEEPVRQNA